MEFDEIIVKESPGLCRCCLSEGCYKDLGTEYTWMNDTEVYADMLLECFDIGISQHNEGPNGPNRLICEVCITRLRDACNFKKQVLESEKRFVDMVGRGDFAPKVVVYPAMKPEVVSEEVLAEDAEVEYLEEDLMDYDDKLPIPESPTPETSDDMSLATLKVKNKRGRPRKTATVEKPEKKTKIAKTEDKPRTSKEKPTGITPRGRGGKKKEDFGTQDLYKHYEDTIDRSSVTQLRLNIMIIINLSTAIPFNFHKKLFNCFYCAKDFTDSDSMRDHTMSEHPVCDVKDKCIIKCTESAACVKFDISSLACKVCLEPMSDLDDLLDHLISEHEANYDKSITNCIQPYKLAKDNMVCPHCPNEFRFFSTLLNHVNKTHTNHKIRCDDCGQTFTRERNLQAHIWRLHRDGKFKCNICDVDCKIPSRLFIHMATEHGVKAAKCSQCPETFPSHYLRQKHLIEVHNSGHKCSYCGKLFTRNSFMRDHIRQIHLKERNVGCSICDMRFFNNLYLRRHMVTHSGEKNFPCDVCGKRFVWAKSLRYHMKTHFDDIQYVNELV